MRRDVGDQEITGRIKGKTGWCNKRTSGSGPDDTLRINEYGGGN